MSLIVDQVRLIDAQLDQLQIPNINSVPSPLGIDSPSSGTYHLAEIDDNGPITARITQLQTAIKSLSAASSSRTLLQPSQLQSILELLKLLPNSLSQENAEQSSSREQELEWLLVGKSTAQIYGLVLNTLLERTLPLSHDIWYWDEVLGSYSSLGLYYIQTSPEWLWRWARDIYFDAKLKLQSTRTTDEAQTHTDLSLQDHWARFWVLVKDTVRDHSMPNIQSQLMSPLTLCRKGVRNKQTHLKRVREMSAAGLGMLMDEGLTFESDDDAFANSKSRIKTGRDEWKSILSKSVSLMETVLRNVTILELGPAEFEDAVFLSVDEDQDNVQFREAEEQLSTKSASLANRLQQILSSSLPSHTVASKKLVAEHGRPSRAVRYWIPAVLVFLSSGTILRVFFSHQTEILGWVQNFGATSIDFWYNWVVHPLKRVIGTIRHDENSEVALMSKRSLEGDKASLERMVVEFVKDNSTGDVSLSDAEVVNIKAKIKEGDLTPVLKAYEKDLRRPIFGTIRGNLIRTLLIQIQKTKVDVEVAVGGIDALLKSQELVFGFISLTPGVLVCVGLFSWAAKAFGSRKGKGALKYQGQAMRNLRNIDRILNTPTSSTNDMLAYKEHGLLLCEVHILRQTALQILPREIYAEFVEELNDLVDLRTGIRRQLRVANRIRWAYDRWLSR